jgi:gluconolactonase
MARVLSPRPPADDLTWARGIEAVFIYAPAMTLSRRAFLATTSTVMAATARPLAQWQESQRYPDPRIEILDPSFSQYRINSAKVERLATGMRWAEGPVWFGDGRYLLWSDIPNDRIVKLEEETAR